MSDLSRIDSPPISVSRRTFPAAPEIPRDNCLDTIDDQVRAGHHALIIEGESGDGKTVLAAAYARRHSTRALFISVSAASKWGYDPHCVLQNIGMEVHRLLGLQPPPADFLFQESDLQALYTRLRRRGTTKDPVLFIVDGLHEIPSEDEHLRRRIVDLVPLGIGGITAVLTDSVPSRLKLRSHAKVKTWRLTKFTLDESREYLKDVISEPSTITELHQTFKGRPGSLAVIRRLLSSGAAAEGLLVNTDGALGSLLEREWSSVGQLSDTELKILGLLVLARTALRSRDVARVLRIAEEDAVAFLQRIPFVHTDRSSLVLSIVGDTMRQFVARKTDGFRKELLDALIADLQRTPAARDSLGTLPRYFQDAGRLIELVTYLTPDRLSESLLGAETLQPLKETLGAGFDAAAKLNRDGDSYRFALQTSAIAEIGSASSWDSQVRAVLALKDFEQAIQIAESVPLAKDKLLLLASIASAQRIDGLSPSDALVDRIRRLLDDVADSLGPEQAVDLAGRLFVVMPDRATQLVQRASASGRPGGTLDWAIAQLTIYASMSRNAAEEAGGSHAELGSAMRAHIRDPELRRFSSSISTSLSTVSAADALAQARTIENPRDRIYFLRHWTDQNRQRADAIEVTQSAIDLVLATTEYSPNARDVLRIARPLRFCTDEAAAMRCVTRLGALLGDLAERGPTAELFRLRILLAATTFRWRREEGRTRFQEEYFSICDITDLGIRGECLSRLMAQLSIADADGYLQAADQLHDLVAQDLRQCVESLLACTADHYELLAPIVAALANTHPAMASDFLAMANTLSRRDALRLHAIEHMLRGPASRLVLEHAALVAQRAETASARAECGLAVWRELEARPKTLDAGREVVDRLAALCFVGRDARDRCVCAGLAYSAIRQAQLPGHDALLARLRELLRRSLTEIDDAWEAVDVALEVCSLLAKADVDLARECLSSAQVTQRDRLGGRAGPTWLLIAPIKLAMASLAGLMRKSCDHSSDSERILSLIQCLPSTVLRVQLRSELAVWCYGADRIDECRRIVQSHVLPEVRRLEDKPDGLFTHCVVAAADGLFLAHPETAKSLFAKLDREYRDLAISRAVAGKLNRIPAAEPYRYDEKRIARLTREDIDELLPLLQMADSDSIVWSVVERLTGGIIEAGNTAFSSQQLSAMSQQMEAVSTDLLPKGDWIRHRGYSILCAASARRIRGRKLDINDSVVTDAHSITNLSDRSFMLAHLSSLTTAESSARLLDAAAEVARQIPVEIAKIDRLTYVAEASMRLKRPTGTTLAKEVCRLAQSCDHGDMDAVRRRIMDAAYRADRELAGALAEAVDSDPARISARAKRGAVQLQEQLKALDASRAVMDHNGESMPPADVERLPAATWQALASLNAGRTQAKRLEDLRPFIRIAAEQPLSEAYPILAWILANARLRFEGTPQAASVLRPFFDACSMVAEFSAASAFPTHTLRLPASAGPEDPMLVRIGQQREGQALLDLWIARNVKSSLLICDPYFGPDDLWVLTAVLKHAPNAEVTILTSREKFKSGSIAAEDQFRARWREISDQEPPQTEIIICGFADSGKLPVHDRWWLSDSAGLRPGTSIGGLGSRESRLNEVDPDELAADRAMVEGYAKRRVRRTSDGRAIHYSMFML